MSEHPLYVALIWHMHQPLYRNLRRPGEITLPWVRLHTAKDYLHMAEVLARYPAVHMTINMVPVLIEQIVAWAEGHASDRLAKIAEQDDLSEDDKHLILNLAFSINWDRVIRRYPRYAELLERRPQALADPNTFSTFDYRDLLAWFNLVWIAPDRLEHDPALAELVAKGRSFTVADLQLIHAKQREIAANVLPRYQELMAQGQLEVTTSPYYHPILPLLIDISSARRASPGLPLPSHHFEAPEDAATQLQLAVAAHTRYFGTRPVGLWPPEGAVSPEILPQVNAAGFLWLASDETILGLSLGQPFMRDSSNLVTNPQALYQPYRVLAGGELGPYIIFRDHELSDRIGFLYQHLPAEQAAEDLIYRLLEIRNRLNDPHNPYLVSIILDGENCWEHYEHNGDPFLNALYTRFSERPELRTVTVTEYLTKIDPHPAGTLARLATGSWIGGDLTTWIGDPEHNRAWELLARARSYLIHVEGKEPSHPGLERAWQALYVAEGSDWFWWYSHRNRSDQDAVFDQLFRDALAAVYEALGEEVPATLEEPIQRVAAVQPEYLIVGYCTPPLTGASYAGEAWAMAVALQPASTSSGTMQRAEAAIERLFVGYDAYNLYLRLELRDRLDDYTVSIYLSGPPGSPTNQRVRARYPDPSWIPSGLMLGWLIQRLPGQPSPFLYRAAGQDQWLSVSPLPYAFGERVLETSISLKTLGLAAGQEFRLLVTLVQRDVVTAQLPERGMAILRLGQ
jgi:alpha-amylase/alpha-mannosidase (GH57 family)